VTAGPTHEPIDSVRYIANRSSGRMGLALADAAVQRRLPTTLLLGPTPLRPPEHSLLTTLRFQTTADLESLLKQHWPAHDVLIMAAAVADYSPTPSAADSSGKLKRGGPMTLQLEPTPDLLAGLTTMTRPDQTVIGFALEPHDRLVTSAQDKLVRKHLHAIVANPLETMDSPIISARVFLPGGKVLKPEPSIAKEQFAEWLLDQLREIEDAARVAKK
jgi:phosphopantothenoylcysteine decarboxylase/phosphopantothenate--cysteine ligase